MKEKRAWLYDLTLVVVLLGAAYFRFLGLDWDQGQHLHPDERFLTMVESALSPARTLSEYFNTDGSPLNPHNRGYGFFVYGDLPVVIVRYLAEWLGQTGYDQVNLVGRQFSALTDLGVIMLLYFIVARLYNRRVALLSAAFSSLAVMQIQQSHFFTVDHPANFFSFLAIFFAVLIVTWGSGESEIGSRESGDRERIPNPEFRISKLFRDPLFTFSLCFGAALGMAVASKLNAAPMAILLPAAFIVRALRADHEPHTTDHRSLSVVHRRMDWTPILVYLIAGGLASLLFFRIFQPYAFDGLGLNPRWLANIQELQAQSSGDADVPFALQWARRSRLYSFENLTKWGLGLPLGILAWIGFLWMGWRVLKGEWKHALLWGWTALYFLWQSMAFNPTMRYQLPIYPLLCFMAAWIIFELANFKIKGQTNYVLRIVSIVIGAAVLLSTFAWTYAFTRIYTRPHTRVAATHWIYSHLPGPINLPIQLADGSTHQQPLPFPYQSVISPESPYTSAFTAQESGALTEVYLPHVKQTTVEPVTLLLSLSERAGETERIITTATLSGVFTSQSGQDMRQTFVFSEPAQLRAGQTYSLGVQLMLPADVAVNLCGPVLLNLQTPGGDQVQTVTPAGECIIRFDAPFEGQFAAQADGILSNVQFAHLSEIAASSGAQSLTFQLLTSPEGNADQILAKAGITSDFAARADARGRAYTLKLDRPVSLVKDQTYFLRLDSTTALTLAGAAPINETSWDDGLPLRMDGYDGFGGLYNGNLNFEIYWEDNADKVNRFVTTMEAGDAIFVTSNRQWASVTRIPERYPLTTEYYRALIGCPPEKDVIWCYNVARPGQFEGRLGFELVAVFESYPTLEIPGLFKYEFNDQFAEEAFTVYDHPKVLIFQKTDSFNAEAVRAHLSAVDLSNVVHLTPRQASHYKPLMLPPDRLAQQQAGGTWSDLFSYDSIQNRYPVIGLLLWYFFIFALGLAAYPLTRLALPGLADKGYPLSRAVGMILLAYFSWLIASIGGTYSRGTIGAVFVILAAAGISLGWMRRDELLAEWKSNRRYYLIVEGIFLAFFLIDLLIRLGNPDLWHPAKGGERPMDFSYFNAILKSTTFPPYDPWFGGGYINYYYYGFVLVGTPVKLLAIVPSIAYNFILPTLFAMVALGAFCIGWNLLEHGRRNAPWLAGISASLMTVLLGNLGTIRMLFQGFQRMAAPGGMIDNANVVQRWWWAIRGFFMAVFGGSLPFGRGDWYWFPSRVIPAPGDVEPINEFPLFTFLYSDLHAHMIVMPVALLALAWTLSIVKSRAQMNRVEWSAAFLLGGLVLGGLYPTNLSDIYTYLLIALAALACVLWFHANTTRLRLLHAPDSVKRLFIIGAGAAALIFLSYVFYEPYRAWYGQAYGAVEPWRGSHTPIWSYLTHWGLFLFVITFWLAWETRQWMAVTPVSALKKLGPYQILIELLLAGLLAMLVYFAIAGVSVGWLALPLAAWAGILLLRRDMPDEKRLVLFWIGTALLITIVVELVVARGDIGRMNTVFKFYLQAWLLFAVSAAAAFGWLLLDIDQWLPRWRNLFQVGLSLLAAGAFLFTLTASTDKMTDRMAPDAPHTLDSMTYMAHATYWDGGNMDLSEDYRAIRWMQDNIPGSPVIVEANCPEYRWCTRFTIYTGLPGVVGWNWHQRQQRALMAPEAVTNRVAEVGNFYNATDVEQARAFLKKYNVKYMIVGQLERMMYPEGVMKFETYDGKYWRSIYHEAHTVIYEVIP